MGTDKSEEKGIDIYTHEYRHYRVKANTMREAIDIFETTDLHPKDDKVEFVEYGDFELYAIANGPEYMTMDEFEEQEAEAEAEAEEEEERKRMRAEEEQQEEQESMPWPASPQNREEE